MRFGIGYDVHPFAADRPLVLGGVRFEGDGLAGYSDGDCLSHALIDALLGAAALGDIGGHFPPGDQRYRGADSIDLLARVAAELREAGYAIVNVDATVVAERPRLAPRAAELRERLAAALGVDAGRVGLKATTTDGLGFTGRGEGIAVIAVASIEPLA